MTTEETMHVPAAPTPPPPLAPPPTTSLQRLVEACRSAFDGSHAPPTADVVSFVCGMIDKIEPDDIGLMDDIRLSNEMNSGGRQNPPIIAFKTIHDCNNFTITVILLFPGASMPLHNHPGLTVFSKLLAGSAHLVSYDWVRPRVCAAAGAESRATTMLAEKVLDDTFTAASGAWALFPDAGGNLHRFVAGEDGPCAVLDVITPPYSPASSETQERYAYYQHLPYELHRPNATEEEKRRLAWIQEVDEPKDFRVSGLPYRGPPTA